MPDKTRSLGISVFHDMKGDILLANLRPGEKLTLKKLSERYQCGASPIREALNQLVVEGWVVRIDKRGFFVSEMSPDGFADILYNRCFMESEALKRSIERSDEAWRERVLLSHFRLNDIDRNEVEPAGSTVSLWETAHRNFHRALISGCGSKLLQENCERLYDLNIRYRLAARRQSNARRIVSEEHDEIKTLTLKGDVEGAVQALVRHYMATGKFLFPEANEAVTKTFVEKAAFPVEPSSS